jgi:hypothetical protein
VLYAVTHIQFGSTSSGHHKPWTETNANSFGTASHMWHRLCNEKRQRESEDTFTLSEKRSATCSYIAEFRPCLDTYVAAVLTSNCLPGSCLSPPISTLVILPSGVSRVILRPFSVRPECHKVLWYGDMCIPHDEVTLLVMLVSHGIIDHGSR